MEALCKLHYCNGCNVVLKISGHQRIVILNETSDQVEDIKSSTNKPRVMEVRFTCTIFCDDQLNVFFGYLMLIYNI